jgi:hypothetical protein
MTVGHLAQTLVLVVAVAVAFRFRRPTPTSPEDITLEIRRGEPVK